MKTLLKLILIVALVLIFGALPLNIFGFIFEWIAKILKIIARTIDFFGWGGIF